MYSICDFALVRIDPNLFIYFSLRSARWEHVSEASRNCGRPCRVAHRLVCPRRGRHPGRTSYGSLRCPGYIWGWEGGWGGHSWTPTGTTCSRGSSPVFGQHGRPALWGKWDTPSASDIPRGPQQDCGTIPQRSTSPSVWLHPFSVWRDTKWREVRKEIIHLKIQLSVFIFLKITLLTFSIFHISHTVVL